MRRRSVPLAVAGAALVVGCALVFAEGWAQAGHRQAVLALAQPVAAGQVIIAADLQVVRVSVAGPVSLVPASRQAQVVGSIAAATLPAGSLLAGSDIGAPPPGKGQVRLGLALKAGQYPPDLAPGQDVDVLAAPASGGSGSSPGTGGTSAALPVGQGVVLSVSPASASSATGGTVVELQVPQDAMPQVAAAGATGQASLAMIPAVG
jgi:SAF domain